MSVEEKKIPETTRWRIKRFLKLTVASQIFINAHSSNIRRRKHSDHYKNMTHACRFFNTLSNANIRHIMVRYSTPILSHNRCQWAIEK